MIVELVFVGTELLLGEILNTNARYLSQQLSGLGIDNFYQVTVGDNPGRLAGVLRTALDRSDVVITSGGLGPTLDDLTREVAAEVAGRPLQLDESVLAGIQAFFQRLGRRMSDNNRRQAMVPEGARVLSNRAGTAPGLIIPAGQKALILLPGPPRELQPMFEEHVVPYLTERRGGIPELIVSRTLKFCGIGESAVEDSLLDLIRNQTDPNIAPYAKPGEVHLRLSTKALSVAAGLQRIAPVERAIRERLGDFIFGVDDDTLEQAVGAMLRERNLTLALAESCTGGLIGQRITSVAGSSEYFLGSAVVYANSAKTALLGVSPELLTRFGAVSEEVAGAMAEGARRVFGADLALSVTGIAGPGGGTPEKPVGTVCFGLAGPDGTISKRDLYWGSRADIRERSAQEALVMLRNRLL